MHTDSELVPAKRAAARDLARAIMNIDEAAADADPAVQEEIRLIKDHVATVYAYLEEE